MMKRIFSYCTFAMAAMLLGMSCNKDSNKEPERPDPGKNYDVAVYPKYAMGSYAPQNSFNQFSNFYIVLSEGVLEGSAEDPQFKSAGNIVWLDLNVDAKTNVLPAGTYNFSDGEPSDFMLSAFTMFGTSDEAGTVIEDDMVEFSEGTLTVKSSGDTYTLELTGKLTTGKTIYLHYKGKIEIETLTGGNDGDLFKRIDKDIETTFIGSSTYYHGLNKNNAGRFTLQLFDYEDEGGYFMDGNMLTISLFGEIKDGKAILQPATYTVASAYGEYDIYAKGDIQPGIINMEALRSLGTNLIQTKIEGDNATQLYGLSKRGTVKVELNGEEYTITVDLKDDNGFAQKGKYVGPLKIVDKSYFSTLTGDYEVQLKEDMRCDIEYYGQYYADRGIYADNWCIYIGYTEGNSWIDGTEALQIDLLCPHGSFKDGLPSGEYVITGNTDPALNDFICLPGEMHSGGEQHCSWYLGGFLGGLAFKEAPLMSGTVIIENINGEYTIMIDAYDDAPIKHSITAEWAGVANLIDNSK